TGDSDASHSMHLTRSDGIGTPLMVEVVLVTVRSREAGDGLIELRAGAQVGGDGQAISRASMRAGHRPAARPRVRAQSCLRPSRPSGCDHPERMRWPGGLAASI